MLKKIYIRYKEDLPESVNNFAALDGFRELGVETAPFYGFGDVETLQDLSYEVGIHGFIGDVQKALVSLGLKVPKVPDYPPELTDFLHRDVAQTTLKEIRNSKRRTFVKPVEHKLFTGFVWEGTRADRLHLATYPDHTPVWVSEPRGFRAEYRAFVLDGEVLDVRKYKGDWREPLDHHRVTGAVQSFSKAPRAYALDFGVTEADKTSLIEANDSYALGHYGLNSCLYAQMISARWEEMTSVLRPTLC